MPTSATSSFPFWKLIAGVLVQWPVSNSHTARLRKHKNQLASFPHSPQTFLPKSKYTKALKNKNKAKMNVYGEKFFNFFFAFPSSFQCLRSMSRRSKNTEWKDKLELSSTEKNHSFEIQIRKIRRFPCSFFVSVSTWSHFESTENSE
jgi:hypothetical protein